MRQSEESTYITVAEIARDLCISKMTVYRAIHDGELPAMRLRRSYRVHRSGYKQWRQRMQYNPPTRNNAGD